MTLLARSLALLAFSPAPLLAQCDFELQEFAAPDGQAGDVFGYRIARSGDVAVVAATFDDDLGLDAGSAYVYERQPGGEWSLAKKLLASDGAANDIFASSVAVHGSTVLVGAAFHWGPAPGNGAVYVFERDQGGLGNWGEVTSFTPATAGVGAAFGSSMVVQGDRLLVGAPHPTDVIPGAAYLYERDVSSPTGWTLVHELVAADPTFGLGFGAAVALHGDTLAVSGATTSLLPSYDGYHVHVFERDAGGAGAWGQVQRIEPSTFPGSYSGYRIALHGDLLALVAPGEYDDVNALFGSIYLHSRDANGAGQWGLLRRLNLAQGEAFLAEQVTLNEEWLVAGSPTGGGRVHLFSRDVGHENDWGLVREILDPALEGLGQGLALEGNELLVGASGVYSSGTSGEVYVYDLAHVARADWRNDAADFNADSLTVNRPVLGTQLEARVDLASTGHAAATLLVFAAQNELGLPGGQVLLGSQRLAVLSTAGPVAVFAADLPNDTGLCGLRVTLQAVHRSLDRTFALSNAQDLRLAAN
jgi:hypothetical protein